MVAAAWLYEAWEPTLLVRGWLLQGVVGGVAVAVGYGVGVLLRRLGRRLRRRRG